MLQPRIWVTVTPLKKVGTIVCDPSNATCLEENVNYTTLQSYSVIIYSLELTSNSKSPKYNNSTDWHEQKGKSHKSRHNIVPNRILIKPQK